MELQFYNLRTLLIIVIIAQYCFKIQNSIEQVRLKIDLCLCKMEAAKGSLICNGITIL